MIAINPMFIYLTPSAGKETLLYFFNLALVISFLKCLVPKNIILNRILFSLVFSLSLYADERYLIFIPFFFFYYIFYKQKEKYIFTTIFIFLSIMILVQTPWTYRNYLVYDRFVLISERTDQFINLFKSKPSKPVLKESLDKIYLSENEIELIIKGELIHYQNGKKINKNILDFIKAGNRPYKFNFLEKAWVNFKSFWKIIDFKNEFVSDGFKFHGKWNLKHNLSSIFFYGFLLPFFIYSGFKNLNKTHINLPFLFTIYASLIHTFIVPFSSDRYRTPYDFFIIIISIHYISTLYKDKHLYLEIFKAKVFEKFQKL